MERLDLARREADERVAVAQRVVEEREGVLTCQRDEPERELGQIDRHRVAVDAVQAALRDEPPGVDDLVFVGGSSGRPPCALQASTSASASCRHASTRNAPEPIAGSQTLRSRIASGRGAAPSFAQRFEQRPSVVRTIGAVSERGV